MRLPVIVSMGGVNAAGRTSGFQSFRRMVIDLLPEAEQQQTLAALAVMMGLVSAEGEKHFVPTAEDAPRDLLTAAEVATRYREQVLNGTLVRRVEESVFDVDALHWQSSASLRAAQGQNDESLKFTLAADQVPSRLPEGWTVEPAGEGEVQVTLSLIHI